MVKPGLPVDVQCNISWPWSQCSLKVVFLTTASWLGNWTALPPMSSLSHPASGIFSESCRHQSGISWAAYPHSQPILHTDLITLFALLFIHMLGGFIFAWTPSLNNALFSLIGWLYNMCRRWRIVVSGSKGGKKRERVQKLWKWDGATEQRKVAVIRKWERARGRL